MTSERARTWGDCFWCAQVGMAPAPWIHGNSRAVREMRGSQGQQDSCSDRPANGARRTPSGADTTSTCWGVRRGPRTRCQGTAECQNRAESLAAPLEQLGSRPAGVPELRFSTASRVCLLIATVLQLASRRASWPCLRAKIIVEKILPGLCVTKQLLRGGTMLPTAC
jgi:hypothetical protein